MGKVTKAIIAAGAVALVPEVSFAQQRNTQLEEVVRKQLGNAEITQIDYVAVVHPTSLEPLAGLERTEQIKQFKLGATILVAVYVGTTRLIDNITIPPTNP